MPDPAFPPVFDGHNDLLTRLMMLKDVPDPVAWAVDGGEGGHLDLPRMRAGGFAGGLFAVFVPPPAANAPHGGTAAGNRDAPPATPPSATPPSDMPPSDMPPSDIPTTPMDFTAALPTAISAAGLLLRIEERSAGALKICWSAAEIRQCMASGVIAAVLHMEGAEAIDAGLDALHVLHAAGLRSLGPVWSRPSIFGEGVPFRFNASPDTGPGLTDAGRALVAACNRMNIMIDLSHLNEKGFYDVAELSDAPLVASHSNAHAICPHARNLTDDQLRAIGGTGGLAGLNFATLFLRPDGRARGDTGLDVMIRHLDHMIETAGLDHVGIGSDFDGAPMPNAIRDVTGLPRLLEAMRAHGYDEDTMTRLCHENWLRVLERTWGG